MEQLSGYYKVLAKVRIESQLNKPFLGIPFLRFGQCYFLCAYFFHLGGILGAKYYRKYEAFGYAFLGMRGEPGAVNNFFTEIEQGIVKKVDIESMKIEDYTLTQLKKRIGFSGDNFQFLEEYFMKETTPEATIGYIWQFAIDGAALGVKNPDAIRKMYKRSNSSITKEKWDLARSVGLDIPPERNIISYQEMEESENGLFMEYCQQCCPDIFNILVS